MFLNFGDFLVIVSSFSLFLILLYIYRVCVVRFRRKEREKSKIALYSLIDINHSKRLRKWSNRHWLLILDSVIEVSQAVKFTGDQQKIINEFLKQNRADLYFYKKLQKKSIYQRCRAARYLGYIDTPLAKNGLVLRLVKEPKEQVKIYILHSISLLSLYAALPDIIDSLKGASPAYIKQVSGVVKSLRSAFVALFPILAERKEHEIEEVLIEFAGIVPTVSSGYFLLKLFNDPETLDNIRILAFTALIDSYPGMVKSEEYIRHKERAISDYAIMGLSRDPNKKIIFQLIELCDTEQYCDVAVKSLSNIIRKDTTYFLVLNDHLLHESRPRVVKSLINVVSNRIDYYLPLINSQKKSHYEFIIREVLKSGRVSNIVSFLNGNHNKEIETILIGIILRTVKDFNLDVTEFRIYLNESILLSMGLSKQDLPKKRINEKNEGVKSAPLYFILAGVFFSLTLIYLNVFFKGDDPSLWFSYIKRAVNDFLLLFGYYCLILNGFYYLLAFLAFINSRDQYKYWNIKDESFLFSDNRLPSLSLLVPGYCEEASIIDNVLSLLNLKYPDYEVIVINDGSSDNTLQVLIDYFNLEKEDMVYTEKLKTQPVRGIYRTRNIPELTVIDKINGGKADSLNVGLNLASKDYFVGIDSDSLLERDALLKLTSSFLDQKEPVVAAGGNIMPINGCRVDHGIIENTRIPSHPVALFQNIEYIRSFMTGRMGWAYIKSLLIISGAFGVFKREDVLRVHGYLTSREEFDKDTVGEDMELVVRLSRDMKERKEPFSLLYLYQANCWTEVPQSLKILRKQRERWQRGLIDILSFHKKIHANPRYGSIGILGFPYYLLAEVIGPWYELIANIIFVVGIALGWVSLPILFLVLGANFILSFSLSLSSLLIMDWNGSIFPVRDRLILILTSLLETLGFRQMVSFYRILGFIGVLRNITGWGAMKRTGFKKKGV